MDRLWGRYQKILADPKREDLNEVSAILYLIGNIYCETIAQEAIERRLYLLKKPLGINEFLTLIDSQPWKISEYRKDPLFSKLEKYQYSC